MSSQEHAAAEFSLRSRVAELEVTNHNLAQERSGLLARAATAEQHLRAEIAAHQGSQAELSEMQSLLSSEAGARRGAQEAAAKAARDAAEHAGLAAEARARAQALQSEVSEIAISVALDCVPHQIDCSRRCADP